MIKDSGASCFSLLVISRRVLPQQLLVVLVLAPAELSKRRGLVIKARDAQLVDMVTLFYHQVLQQRRLFAEQLVLRRSRQN